MTSASDALRDRGPGSASGDRSASRYDLASGIGCYVLWSGLSILFMGLAAQGAGPGEILASRCLWSLPWALGIVLLTRGGPEARAILGSPRTLLWLAASAALVSGNWAMFIWASTNGHKLDASLAYYINPLLNMGAGALLFRERFSRTGAAAIVLACLGVALQGLAVGHPPWLALALALSFWGYGVIRKQAPAGAQAGLFVECLMLAPLGLAYLVWIGLQGRGHLGAGLPATLLLLATGPATVIPLALFAHAARKLPLSTLGFLQFVMPTALFEIAMATGEAMTPLRAASFLFIWAGVGVFSLGALGRRAARKG
ncbi:MAG: EamA family transporter RarD [Caulobacteraceae bacterium]